MARRKRNECEEDNFQASSSKPRRKSELASGALSQKHLRRNTKPNDTTKEEARPILSGHPKSTHIVSSPSLLRKALLRWYTTVEGNRGMPWRKTYNPNLSTSDRAQRAYEVVTIQQTQVATVIPYYNAWMKKFPTVTHLANSSVDEVNALWKGLGYYSRGKRLLDAARILIRDYEGKLPDNAKEMEANIPGIGRYSAGAICSIAYGERVPVLDGNVHRFFSRFLALHAPPKSKAALDVLWAAATAMVQDDVDDVDHPGDINQALIELGSTICKIRDPMCGDCPLNRWCGAYNESKKRSITDIEDLCTLCEPLPDGQHGVVAYPMKVKKKKARTEVDVASVIEWRSVDDRQFLLVRRPDKGLLAGLYEFPLTPLDCDSTSNGWGPTLAHQQVVDVIEDSVTPYKKEEVPRGLRHNYSGGSDYRIVDVVLLGDVSHTFSHIKKTYHTQWVVIEGGIKPPLLKYSQPKPEHEECQTSQNSIWLSISEVTKANISTGVSKIWKLFMTIGAERSDCE
ncbi:DNA glycosylase [Lentinula raphanica]|uniref:Adenine DNA glycosylase n=1 Tax=Lentinula raphanica TaxID=153919 RepID=A0AA38PC35_9AGAR|nr:DNA glycosylase [Lentinula raphanica]